VANVLIFIHVILINQLFINSRLSREMTLLAGLLYVIFNSVIAEGIMLSPILMANTFVLLAVIDLMKTYKTPNPSAYIFNAGFFLSLASLFYTPYIVLFLFGVFSILLLRSFQVYEKLQYTAGYIVPYFFLFTFKYWEDLKFVELSFFKEIFFRMPDYKFIGFELWYLSFGFFVLCILFALLNYSKLTGKKSIQVQKRLDILYWYIVFCVVSFLVFSTDGILHLLSLSLPLSILIGIWVSDSKSRITHELLHILIVAFIFIAQFKLITI
jgi:hypothetical protein